MKRVTLGVIVACLIAGRAAAAESAAEAIRAFGLIGTWSADCKRDPYQACENNRCGARLTYIVPTSGAPTIRNVIGTFSPGQVRTFVSTIHSATRVAGDKLKIVSVQDPPPSTTLVWWRQPGEIWEIVLLKVGDKYRTFSAHRDDWKKIEVDEGFEVRPPPPPPPAQVYVDLPTKWLRGKNEMPLFERCSD
ncbi:hypothetical protein [Bradyrhizobium liaoningense]|uniref:hypothetical protein n=1 Tax=Bradyrhizobium liaoningense TaxID=43992 RepID=UPI001BA9F7F7|nr:hypothetical protein [Bradyrhizobium liaoningense]MBR0818494.1 hypothetical protein [Bradyrhizobium liaoningense]